jgi:multidrug efflux system membrane fusion protein
MDTKTPDAIGFIEARGQRTYEALKDVSPRWRLVGGILLALVAVALAYEFFGSSVTKKTPPPPPVRVARAVQRTMPVVEHTIGTVIANAIVQVTARVSGELESAPFTEGQIVQQGQLLFQLDPRPFEAAVAQAQGQLGKDQASLASAQADKRRYDELYKENATSASQRDTSDAAANGLVATVQSDKAAVDMAQLNLIYAAIKAPFTGKTGPILIQPGNLITANATNPLVTLTQIQPVKVSFALPQSDLPRIQDRMRANKLTATIDVHGPGGARLTAPIDFVSNAVSDQTGTIELRATFANLDYKLVPGQLVDVGVTLNEISKAVVVPRDAVNAGPDKNFVYLLDKQSKVAMVPVDVLFDDGTNDAVHGNIRPGDSVVTEGQLRLVPGIKVSVTTRGNLKPPSRVAPGAQ